MRPTLQGLRRWFGAPTTAIHDVYVDDTNTVPPPLTSASACAVARFRRLTLLLYFGKLSGRYVQVNAGVPYWEAIILVSVAARIAVLPAVTTFVRNK